MVSWVVWTTINTSTRYTLGQLVFNHDMIMQTAVTVNWELIENRRQGLAITTNTRENKNCLEHYNKKSMTKS